MVFKLGGFSIFNVFFNFKKSIFGESLKYLACIYTFLHFQKKIYRILNMSSIWTQKPGSKADIYTAAVLFEVVQKNL